MRATYLDKAFPDAYNAAVAASQQATAAANSVGIAPITIELIKLRASQLNGCAYCLRMHTRIALELGDSTDRLAVLQNWRDTTYFTDEERAALAITEEATLIADVTAGRRPPLAEHETVPLSAEQIAAVRWVAIAINTFNRVSILSEHPVRPERGARRADGPQQSEEAVAPAQGGAAASTPRPDVVEELSEFLHADERDE